MKTHIMCWLAVIVLLAMASCQKDQDIKPAVPVSQSENVGTPDPGDSGDIQLKHASILNATSVSGIPSQFFGGDPRYVLSYQHFKQNYNPTYGECSWTSYVIAAACIIKGNCNYCSYPVSTTKINQVKNACSQQFGGLANGSAITSLKWYCQNYDYQKLYCYQKSTSSRFVAIQYMLDHLANYRSPFLVISTRNGVAHYLIVHAIDWKAGLTGSTVYYTDCATISTSGSSYFNNEKQMTFSSFLSKMIDVPNYYNMLFLWPKPY